MIGGNDAQRGAGFACMHINVRSHVKNRDFCSQLKIPIFLDFQSVICMSKVVRSVLKERGFFGKKEELVKCEKCRKKPAGQDGLCDSCRFGALLTQMIESREH